MKIKPKTKFRDFVVKMIELTKGNDNPQVMIPVRHQDEEFILSILVIPKKDIEQLQTLREADGIQDDDEQGHY